MDFIDDVGDTSGTPEIAVDDLGRWEIVDDHVKLTLLAQQRNGPVPAVCLVWTKSGLHRNRERYRRLYDVLSGRLSIQGTVVFPRRQRRWAESLATQVQRVEVTGGLIRLEFVSDRRVTSVVLTAAAFDALARQVVEGMHCVLH